MRRRRAVLAALAALAVLALSLLTAGPAAAGGPTSVLLVVPGTGHTASLYTTEADYQALAEFVGASEITGGTAPTTDGAATGSSSDYEVGLPVNVTWLIHDVMVWRVDHIHVAGTGIWIGTQSTLDDPGAVGERPVTWHAASRPKELTALLTKLGVNPTSLPPSSAAPAGQAPPAAATAPADPADDAGAPAAVTTIDRVRAALVPDIRDGVWAVTGLVLGAGLGVLAVVLVSGRRRSAESRRPSAGDADDGTAGAAREEEDVLTI